MQGQEQRPGRILSLALVASCVAALAVHGYLGLSNRYLADDYCFASIARSEGLLAAQRHWYLHWRGVFSHSFLMSLVGLADPRLVSYLPAMILGLWFAALTWTAAQFALIVRARSPVVSSIAFAALVLYATVYGAPNVVQSLHWLSGTLSYTAPLILLTFFAGIAAYLTRRLAGRRPGLASVALSGALPLIAGGFSEVYLAVQTGLLAATVLLGWRIAPAGARRTFLPLMLAGLVGSLLAVGIVALAPGNAARQAFFHQPPFPLVVAPLLSPVWALLVLAGFVLFSVIPLAVLALGSGVLAAAHPPEDLRLAARAASLLADRRRAGWWIGLSLATPAVLASMATLYGVFAGPPTRAQVVPLFVMANVAAFWSIVVTLAWHQAAASKERRLASARIAGSFVGLGMLLLIPLASALANLSYADDLRAYAAKWDLRDHHMRKAAWRGERNLIVPALGYTGRLDDLELDPKHWVNECVARYYGVDSVRAERHEDRDFPWWFQAR